LEKSLVSKWGRGGEDGATLRSGPNSNKNSSGETGAKSKKGKQASISKKRKGTTKIREDKLSAIITIKKWEYGESPVSWWKFKVKWGEEKQIHGDDVRDLHIRALILEAGS